MCSMGNKCGFSLVEVNLAVFVMAMGLLALMVLFPKGLEESELGIADTSEGMFADYILNKLEGNAMAITNWADWVSAVPLAIDGIHDDYMPYVVPFPVGATYTNYINYKLKKEDDGIGRRRYTLEVKSGRYGSFDLNKRTYVTELFYCGM